MIRPLLRIIVPSMASICLVQAADVLPDPLGEPLPPVGGQPAAQPAPATPVAPADQAAAEPADAAADADVDAAAANAQGPVDNQDPDPLPPRDSSVDALTKRLLAMIETIVPLEPAADALQLDEDAAVELAVSQARVVLAAYAELVAAENDGRVLRGELYPQLSASAITRGKTVKMGLRYLV